MTAYQAKEIGAFYQDLVIYTSIFVVGTPIVAYYSYVVDLLSVRWRTWLTEHMIDSYFQGRAYYHVKEGGVIDNPDERIQQNVRDFCTMTLNLMLVLVRGFIVFVSFGFFALAHLADTDVCSGGLFPGRHDPD